VNTFVAVSGRTALLALVSITLAAGFSPAVTAAEATNDKPQVNLSFPPPKAFFNLDAEKFDQVRLKNPNAVVLDVRTPEEFSQGHIPGAKLINFNSPEFKEEVSKLDPKKTYLVNCAAGGRSAKACQLMHDQGFKTLINLDGGIRAWQKAGKPVEK
jgi:phage shock protein E